MGQGQKTPWGQTFDVNRKPLSLRPFVKVLKQSLWSMILNIILNDFIHVYSHGARAENPLGTNLWCQQKALITLTISPKFQTNLFEFWFYTHFLMFFLMYIAPGQGQTTLCGQNLMSTEKPCHFAHLLLSFKKISLKSDFIHNFSCIYTCIQPQGRSRQPLGVRTFI